MLIEEALKYRLHHWCVDDWCPQAKDDDVLLCLYIEPEHDNYYAVRYYYSFAPENIMTGLHLLHQDDIEDWDVADPRDLFYLLVCQTDILHEQGDRIWLDEYDYDEKKNTRTWIFEEQIVFWDGEYKILPEQC